VQSFQKDVDKNLTTICSGHLFSSFYTKLTTIRKKKKVINKFSTFLLINQLFPQSAAYCIAAKTSTIYCAPYSKSLSNTLKTCLASGLENKIKKMHIFSAFHCRIIVFCLSDI